MVDNAMAATGSYTIERDRWGIASDGTAAAKTVAGINRAIAWAKAQGYRYVFLPGGHYKVKMDPSSFVAITLPSDLIFEMAHDCIIELEANSSPIYTIIEMKHCKNTTVTGGRVIGDREGHQYELFVTFERGGVNADGSLNDDPNWIRSEVVDRYDHPGLLSNFRLWAPDGLKASTYHFYQYRDTVSPATFVGFRDNGVFAPTNPTGRGWFLNGEGGIAVNNKMIFAINIANSPLSDEQIAQLRGKIDHVHYTHESGHGIGIYASSYIEVAGVEVSHCVGDAIMAGRAEYRLDPTQYTPDDMGKQVTIRACHLHHCRRQGISLCAPNDVHVLYNDIHHIGYADDGVTTGFRYGTAPMYGIDIESMVTETNIPYKSPERPDGLELNHRLYISENHIHDNARGHLVNVDGTAVTIANNTFAGYNIGGVQSHAHNRMIRFINNTLHNCELWVQGDQEVHGATIHNGNLRLLNVRGVVIDNCHIHNGMLYGSATYGYFGTPQVSVADSTFTVSAAHGMGNGAQISFEQWSGKVPTGISVDQRYYTVNTTPTSFQVATSPGGAPVKISDAGEGRFNVGRLDYGHCTISNVTVERAWRPDNAATPNVNIVATGMVMNNVTVKNYDVTITVPAHYAGRPNIIDRLTLLEGALKIESSQLSNSHFMRAKSSVMGGGDIQIGSNDQRFIRKLIVSDCIFSHIGLVLEGNQAVHGCTFYKAQISKANNDKQAVIAHSYFEDVHINLHWVRHERSVTFAHNVFKDVAMIGTAPYIVQVNNTEL